MAKTKPVRVAILGLGRIGWSHHAEIIGKRKDFKITAVLDTMEERLEEARKKYGCETFTDYNKLLKSGLADLVVVATRSDDHAEMSIKALKAGLHVLVEKPMAINYAEAKKMVAAAKKAKKILTVHQSVRFSPTTLFINEILKSKILGKLLCIKVRGNAFVRRNDWQTVKKFGGGLLNNWGAHLIDSALLAMNSEVDSIWGDMKATGVTGGDADDYMKAIIKGKNGCVIDAEATYACAFSSPSWTIWGTTGTLVITGEGYELKYFDPKKVKKLKSEKHAAVGRKYGNDDKLPWKEKSGDPKPKQTVDFYGNLFDAIRKRKKLFITPESVLSQIKTLDAIRACADWK